MPGGIQVNQPSNDKVRFLRNLRAVRDYTSEPIPDEMIQDILEVGRWSGSASNVQSTEVVVVRDAAVKQRMSELGARPAEGAASANILYSEGSCGARAIAGALNSRILVP